MRVQKNKEDPSVTNNTWLKTTSLGWKSKGLLAYLLSLPTDEKICSEKLATHSTYGINNTTSTMKNIMETICILAKTPLELTSYIMQKGIILTGSDALLKGIDTLINKETHMPVHISENPPDCVAIGMCKNLDTIDVLSKRGKYEK